MFHFRVQVLAIYHYFHWNAMHFIPFYTFRQQFVEIRQEIFDFVHLKAVVLLLIHSGSLSRNTRTKISKAYRYFLHCYRALSRMIAKVPLQYHWYYTSLPFTGHIITAYGSIISHCLWINDPFWLWIIAQEGYCNSIWPHIAT